MQEKVLPGSTVFTFLNCTYLNRYLTTAFYKKWSIMGMLYLLCCAMNMYGVNPGGQKAQGYPRLAGPGSSGYRVRCHRTGPSGPCSSSQMSRERRRRAQHSVSVVKQGTAAKAPLMEHNARELFYGGPRPCGELAIALATGNWLARKAANWLTHQWWSIN